MNPLTLLIILLLGYVFGTWYVLRNWNQPLIKKWRILLFQQTRIGFFILLLLSGLFAYPVSPDKGLARIYLALFAIIVSGVAYWYYTKT